jgi:hypothetical protein
MSEVKPIYVQTLLFGELTTMQIWERSRRIIGTVNEKAFTLESLEVDYGDGKKRLKLKEKPFFPEQILCSGVRFTPSMFGWTAEYVFIEQRYPIPSPYVKCDMQAYFDSIKPYKVKIP